MMGVVLAALVAAAADQPVGPGIAESLARERVEALSNVRYELAFVIPPARQTAVLGRVVVRATLKAPHRIVLDFEQPRDHVQAVRVHGRAIGINYENGHLVIPADETVAGENQVEVQFTAGDEALNRNDEFLYTLHVPARARFTFPCFDQPDVKARYTLTLMIPDGWQVVANGADTQQREMVPGREPGTWSDTVRFAETAPLPTYLFSFVAGKFSTETATRNGRTFHMLHRETDPAKVARNRDAIFDLHAAALAWLEDYTGIKYPFGKFDFVMIPSFQFGGMEHPGAILYNAANMMLDESATQNQLLERASTIAHETAHMWFGDLVTMRWFNDVWMKEVFANFMAAKIVNPSFPQVNHALRFLLSNYPQAYQVDRTAGANPIRQALANLTEAGQLYGPIIYQKAPIVMRQLELIVGETAFRDGLREYLGQYSFGNATWLDLIRILDARTRENLAAWSRAWVDERGRPTFTTTIRTSGDGRLDAIVLTQSDPMTSRHQVWPQRLTVTLGYPDGLKDLPAYAAGRQVVVPGARRLPRPQFVLPNGGGLGYGLFLLDADSRRYLLEHVSDVPDALTRGSSWVTLWDNMLEGQIAPGVFFDAAMRALPLESDEQNVQRVLSYVVRTFWRFLPTADRASRGRGIESMLRDGLARATTASQKSAWFNAFRDTALSRDGLAWLERVWRREERVPGLPFAETDEITMAQELAVREVPGWESILQTQLERTQNPDRKARFAFVIPALSADARVRQQAFDRFRLLENRRREPWVLDSLQYLNHPLREADANGFVTPALELLREIQRTGDIFFPTRWTESTLAGHRSPEAAASVRAFLARERDLPERLRWVVLTAADELFRASGNPPASGAISSARQSP
jgi:aminopeptidase N